MNKFHERKSCVITNDSLYIMQGALPKNYNLVIIVYIDTLNIIISFPFFFPFLQTLPYIFPFLALFQIHSFYLLYLYNKNSE